MPSKLLAECIDQLEYHGIGSPEFRDYFLSKKSRLLSNIDIACDLVVLAVQDDDPSGNAVQLLSLLLDEARMGLENDSAYAEDFLETVEMAVQAGLAAGAVKQRNLMELAGLYRQVGLTVPQSLMLDPDNMAPQPDMENFDLTKNLEGIARDMLADGGSPYDLFCQ